MTHSPLILWSPEELCQVSRNAALLLSMSSESLEFVYSHQEDGRQELACRWSELLAAVTVFVKEHWWGA
jgi:hypothetical protein